MTGNPLVPIGFNASTSSPPLASTNPCPSCRSHMHFRTIKSTTFIIDVWCNHCGYHLCAPPPESEHQSHMQCYLFDLVRGKPQ